jgi:hypothetical protein
MRVKGDVVFNLMFKLHFKINVDWLGGGDKNQNDLTQPFGIRGLI